MKTDDLISALAADAATPARRLKPAVALAVVVGACAALVVFLTLFHVRPDAAQALATVRFPLKFVLVFAFGAAVALLAVRLARPGADLAVAWRALGAAAALVAVAVFCELFATPSGDWVSKLFGRNWALCLGSIPLLSAGPLAVLLVAFRRGAPERPAALGAAAGGLAGALGALLYAAHCVDDSPLFVAAWYPLAIGAVAAAGAVFGSRTLRW